MFSEFSQETFNVKKKYDFRNLYKTHLLPNFQFLTIFFFVGLKINTIIVTLLFNFLLQFYTYQFLLLFDLFM